MTKPIRKRKTRSDRFPLILHKTGQYCKKIGGKLYYFGSERRKALQHYPDQAPCLHNGHGPMRGIGNASITMKALCNLYLEHQESRVEAGELTARRYADQVQGLRKLVRLLGQHREILEVSALDLQNCKRTLQGKYASTHRMNLHLSIMKAVFRWTGKNNITERI